MTCLGHSLRPVNHANLCFEWYCWIFHLLPQGFAFCLIPHYPVHLKPTQIHFKFKSQQWDGCLVNLFHLFSSDFQGDTLLSESSHFTFVYDDNECSLVVLNTQADDSGVYTCTAKNLAGSVSCKAELTVHTGEHFAINAGGCISKHVDSPPYCNLVS